VAWSNQGRHLGGYWVAQKPTARWHRAVDGEEATRVVVCNAPIVEGSVMAADESSASSALGEVRRAAEENVFCDRMGRMARRIRLRPWAHCDHERGWIARAVRRMLYQVATSSRKGVDRASRRWSRRRQEHRASNGPEDSWSDHDCFLQPKARCWRCGERLGQVGERIYRIQCLMTSTTSTMRLPMCGGFSAARACRGPLC